MAITLNTARQCVNFAYVDINLADVTTGVDVTAMELPPNSIAVTSTPVVTSARLMST